MTSRDRAIPASCRRGISWGLSIALLGGLHLCVMSATALMAAPSRSNVHQHYHDHQHEDPHNHGHEHRTGGDERSTDSSSASETAQIVWTLTLLYGVLIAAASWIGGILPRLVTLTHNRVQTLLSFVGGLMLGIGVMHMLPHALHAAPGGAVDALMLWVLAGVLLMFALLRAFHFHVHEPPVVAEADSLQLTCEAHPEHVGGACRHGPAHESGHAGKGASWGGVLFGLGVHTLLDGVALGASIQAEAGHASGWGLYGLGVAAAIALHKPMDSLSISSLMATAGASSRRRTLVNLGYAMLCPLGAVLFHLGAMGLGGGETPLFVAYALAFSAGMFLTIALSDLLPEMQFHSHNRVRLSAALLLGVLAAWAIGFLEPTHLHGH
ncbi:MAG: ZIP family metal transporter [Planctomycetaceae bacterium]